MIQFIIDGNNLIGKLAELKKIQKKDKQSSREKLVFMLDRYFETKKLRVSLHLDGYPGDHIGANRMHIVYSENKTADEKIKLEIDKSKNKRLLSIVTSDRNLMEYARVNSCKVIKSENFVKELTRTKAENSEEKIAENISPDEIKKLFGVE